MLIAMKSIASHADTPCARALKPLKHSVLELRMQLPDAIHRHAVDSHVQPLRFMPQGKATSFVSSVSLPGVFA
jgi:hypothetical protein